MIPKRRPKIFYGYLVVAVSFLIMVVMWGANYTFGVFFEPLLDEFGWSRAATSGAFSLSLALLGIFGIGAGKLTDRFGPRIVVSVCGFFLGLGYLLLSQMNAIWELYLFYGVMIAIGVSGSFVPLASTVARWFVGRRGMMTGITVSGIGVGMLVVPPLASWLIASYGWRTAYQGVGLLAWVLILIAAQFLRRDPGKMGELPYGEQGLAGKESAGMGFSLREAIQTRQFWLLSVAFVSLTVSTGTIPAHIVLHAIGLGISPAKAAVILATMGGLSTVGRIIIGGVGDRIGTKLALIIGFGLFSLALFWLLVAKELWMLYLFAIVFGFGYGGIAALISPSVAELFGLSSHGAILGVIIGSIQTTEGIGPVVAGYIFDVTGSYQLAFLMCALASVIGLGLVSCLPSARRGKAGELADG